jgi:hypothetical protein
MFLAVAACGCNLPRSAYERIELGKAMPSEGNVGLPGYRSEFGLAYAERWVWLLPLSQTKRAFAVLCDDEQTVVGKMYAEASVVAAFGSVGVEKRAESELSIPQEWFAEPEGTAEESAAVLNACFVLNQTLIEYCPGSQQTAHPTCRLVPPPESSAQMFGRLMEYMNAWWGSEPGLWRTSGPTTPRPGAAERSANRGKNAGTYLAIALQFLETMPSNLEWGVISFVNPSDIYRAADGFRGVTEDGFRKDCQLEHGGTVNVENVGDRRIRIEVRGCLSGPGHPLMDRLILFGD